MVGLRRAKTLLFVVLVVMATTIANGAKMLIENDKDEPSKGSGETIDVKASGAKGDGITDDSKVRTISYIVFFLCLNILSYIVIRLMYSIKI